MAVKLIKRPEVTGWDNLKITILSVGFSLVCFSIVFIQTGLNPLHSYLVFFDYAFTPPGLFTTIQNTTALLLVTLAFILPMKSGLWNIGAEGQLFIGAIGATAVALAYPNLPPIILLPSMMALAIILGAVWGVIPGYLKSKMNVNEIVTSLLLNYVAVLIVKYLTAGPWQTPHGRVESPPFSPNARIPILGDSRIVYTLFLAIGLAILLHFFLTRTKLGYEITTFGHSPPAAKVAGMNYTKISVLTMSMAGALAALAGFHQSAGVLGKLRFDLSPGWGYIGIVFGLLVNLHCLWAIIATFFLTGFLVGTDALQTNLGMGFGVEDLFIGVLFLLFVAFQFLRRYKIKWR